MIVYRMGELFVCLIQRQIFPPVNEVLTWLESLKQLVLYSSLLLLAPVISLLFFSLSGLNTEFVLAGDLSLFAFCLLSLVFCESQFPPACLRP